MNLEESLAALTRAHAVVLADGVVSTHGADAVLAGRRRAGRPRLGQGGLDDRRHGGAAGRSRVRRRRQGEVAAGAGRRQVAARRRYRRPGRGGSRRRLDCRRRADRTLRRVATTPTPQHHVTTPISDVI